MEANNCSRCIVGPPSGGPLLRLFGLAAWNGWGNMGLAHLACVRLFRFSGVGWLEQHIVWAASDQGHGLVAWNSWGGVGSAHLVCVWWCGVRRRRFGGVRVGHCGFAGWLQFLKVD